jgi:hypothetical protein
LTAVDVKRRINPAAVGQLTFRSDDAARLTADGRMGKSGAKANRKWCSGWSTPVASLVKEFLMPCRARLFQLLGALALLFISIGIVGSVPAQGRLRLNLPPANPPGGVHNGGSNLGFIPPPPVQAPALGQPVLISGNFGQQGQLGMRGALGAFGAFGTFGSIGNLGTTGSFGFLGAFGGVGGALSNFGSFGTFGAAGQLGAIGAVGGNIGVFGGGAFGKSGGALGANGAVGL